MKILDIAIKDLVRSLRSAMLLVSMFGIPLMVTGIFYFMFGNIAQSGEFNLPRVHVVIANLDEGGPNLGLNDKNVPGDFEAETLGELVVEVLQSDDLADLIQAEIMPDAAAARAAVDSQQAQVAVIIPVDFSHQFADPYGKAEIEFYQDPTLTISPGVVKSILSQFMDGMAGVKIAADIAQEQAEMLDDPRQAGVMVGGVIQEYLRTSMVEEDDLSEAMLMVSAPQQKPQEESNPVLSIVGPIMAGMMIFYAFYTGVATAESILREEEERTMQRLFTTPTPQAIILSGKFLSVFLTVVMQVVVLLAAAHLLFGIQWGDPLSVAVAAFGLVFSASSFGIFVNSMLKDTKQGGIVFGGIISLTGMVGMMRTFSMNSASAATVSQLVPQGWAVRGMLETMGGQPLPDVLMSTLVMLVWGAVFFLVGVWRFHHRYV